jgi:hypothetical protein
MFCREATSLLTEAQEGALRGAKKAMFEVHLTLCGPCKRYRAQLEATSRALANLPKEQPPSGLVDLLAGELEKKT